MELIVAYLYIFYIFNINTTLIINKLLLIDYFNILIYIIYIYKINNLHNIIIVNYYIII